MGVWDNSPIVIIECRLGGDVIAYTEDHKYFTADEYKLKPGQR
jgi:hypothetical protein